MSENVIKILIADDHGLLREGLGALLALESDMRVVAHAEDGHAAVVMAHEHRPDVVIMDISMPKLNGIDATRRIVAELSNTHVLCMSAHSERRLVDAMLQAGAKGYLLKSGAAKEFVGAIRSVAGGQVYLSPSIAGDVVRHYIGRDQVRPTGEGPFVTLTAREREVMQLVAEGLHTKEIAARLGIGGKTVLAHRDNLMKKLGLNSIVALTRYALREGMTEL